MVNGTSNSTIFPRASAAWVLRSSKLDTTRTSAWTPSFGVATLPPSPSIGRVARRGSTRPAFSLPPPPGGTPAPAESEHRQVRAAWLHQLGLLVAAHPVGHHHRLGVDVFEAVVLHPRLDPVDRAPPPPARRGAGA